MKLPPNPGAGRSPAVKAHGCAALSVLGTDSRAATPLPADPASLARRNTLGCLYANAAGYLKAGNRDAASLFGEAIEARLQMIECGELEVGEFFRG